MKAYEVQVGLPRGPCLGARGCRVLWRVLSRETALWEEGQAAGHGGDEAHRDQGTSLGGGGPGTRMMRGHGAMEGPGVYVGEYSRLVWGR